jgi:hypothetical protein
MLITCLLQLPLDINDPATAAAMSHGSSPSESTTTNMSSFLHMTRMRQIESKINQEIFRVDQPIFPSDDQISAIIDELNHWRASAPQISSENQLLYDTAGYFDLYYDKAIRLLLQSRLIYASSHDQWLRVCLKSCGRICQKYKYLHQTTPLAYTLMAVHSIFVAGITILYCLWVDRSLFEISTMNDIRACSTVLFIVAERWPNAVKYRDIFEMLTTVVLEMVDSDAFEPRKPIESNMGNMVNAVQNELVHGNELLGEMVGVTSSKSAHPATSSFAFMAPSTASSSVSKNNVFNTSSRQRSNIPTSAKPSLDLNDFQFSAFMEMNNTSFSNGSWPTIID